MNTKSFTLIEILVAIVILGILSTFIIVSLNSVVDSANDAKRKKDLDSISKMLMTYRILNGSYPDESGIIETALSDLIPDYTTSFPKDPSGLSYNYSSDGTTYTLTSQTLSYNSEHGFAEGVEVSHGIITYSDYGTYTFDVPAGINVLSVKIWGGGGGGGYDTPSYGGGGGYSEGLLNVTPEETITILVGGGGKSTGSASAGGYGGGGNAGTSNGAKIGGGGGRTEIVYSNGIIIAGGGGGAGATGGGAGGGVQGVGTTCSTGGSNGVGGIASNCGWGAGANGGIVNGGNGGNRPTGGGGGGGGAGYGGGAGGAASSWGGAGGGGRIPSGGTTTAGSGNEPGNSSDSVRSSMSSCGYGGNPATQGSDGCVWVSW